MQPAHDFPETYSKIYVDYARYLDEIITAEGRGLSLGRASNLLQRRIFSVVAQACAGDATDQLGYVFSDYYHHIPAISRSMLGFVNRMLAAEVLCGALPSGCDQIVELGSGWGANLLYLWLFGGPRCEYLALEGSEIGRNMSDRLAALEPSLRFRSSSADVYNFESRLITGSRALLFTVDVFNLLDNLPNDLFDRLVGAEGVVSGLHIECMSWQMRSDLGNELDHRSRDYVQQHGRNENFHQLIMDAQARGLIEITQIRHNNHAMNSLMPYSIIEWKRGPAGRADRSALEKTDRAEVRDPAKLVLNKVSAFIRRTSK